MACAQEISTQLFALSQQIDHVVCASGSAGTHAGLLTGLQGSNAAIPVTGINVSRTKEAQEELVHNLVDEMVHFLQLQTRIPRETVQCFGDYVGEGYSIPTPGMVEAVKLLAKHEAILLDPVYTGKAMAGLIDLVKKGYFSKNENILFVHTGGSPALFAYTESFWGSPE